MSLSRDCFVYFVVAYQRLIKILVFLNGKLVGILIFSHNEYKVDVRNVLRHYQQARLFRMISSVATLSMRNSAESNGNLTLLRISDAVS